MFTTNYYCLVAGLKEYSLDADTKGVFDAKAIVGGDPRRVDGADADAVRLLYGYYDCENIASLRAGRSAHNPLGNFTREELEEEVKTPGACRRRSPRIARLCRPRRRGCRGGRYGRALRECALRSLLRGLQPFPGAVPARMVGVRPQPAQCDGRRDGPCGGAAVEEVTVGGATWSNSWSVARLPISGCGASCPTSTP